MFATCEHITGAGRPTIMPLGVEQGVKLGKNVSEVAGEK